MNTTHEARTQVKERWGADLYLGPTLCIGSGADTTWTTYHAPLKDGRTAIATHRPHVGWAHGAKYLGGR